MQQLTVVVLGGGSLLDLDATFFVQLVIFWIAFFALRSLVFKPAMALFDAREEAIEGARVDAKRMEREAESKADSFDEEMRKVRLDAGQERDRLRVEGQRLERQILEKVRKETQETLAEAERKMHGEAARVRAELRAGAPGLAREMASRLLGREVRSDRGAQS